MSQQVERQDSQTDSSSIDDWEDQNERDSEYHMSKYVRKIFASKYCTKLMRDKQDEQFPQLLRFLEVGEWKEVEKLIANGIDVLDVGYEKSNSMVFKTSPLVHACKYGQIECMTKLVGLEKDKNGPSETPRFYHEAVLQAARGGHWDCFHFLMECELLKNESSEENRFSPFINASKTGQFDSIPQLLCDEKLTVLFHEKWGNNLASLLLTYGCPCSCLAALVDHGVDLNGHDSLGFTPLMSAVLAENVECVKFLLEKYVELNTIILRENKDFSQLIYESSIPVERTAFMYAASMKNSDCLREMVEFCCMSEFDYKPIHKWRALTFACYYGNSESVSILIDAGAKVEIFDCDDNSLILYAMHSGNTQCVLVLLNVLSKEFCLRSIQMCQNVGHLVENADCLRIFLEYLDIKMSYTFYTNGKTFLHVATMYNCLESVRLLLELGADIGALDTFKCTPLYNSCEYSNYQVVELLIKHGANADHCLHSESVIVITAAKRDNGECLKVLLDAGVNLNVTNWEGGTVFTTAMTGNGNCMKVLLESGRLLDDNNELKTLHRNAMKIFKDDKIRIHFSLRSFILTIRHNVFDWDWWSPGNFKKIIFAALHVGICPGIIQYKGRNLSPLVLAFQRKQKFVVKYLLANLYFYLDDFIQLSRGAERIRGCLQRCSGLLKIFDNLVCQPLSLQSFSFFTISKAISLGGTSSERGRRVDCLPVPESIKRALKFQTNVSKICGNSWKTINAMKPGNFIFLEKLPWSIEEDHVTCPDSCYYCEGLGLCPK